MLEIYLLNHDNYYAITDCVRLFYDHPVEDKEGGRVFCEAAPDIRMESYFVEEGYSVCKLPDGREIKYPGEPIEAKRDVRRSVYMALSEISGQTAPWGCLTGIRPTLVAGEEPDSKSLSERYLVRPDKADLAMDTYKTESKILSEIPQEDINIYVGIPFCPSRCEYCSFVSQDINHHMDRLKNYKDALINEIKTVAPKINRHIKSIYLGGGTPTVFEDEDFGNLIEAIYENFRIDENTEVTVEAGRPDTITEYKLAIMKAKGVNRICINPQTMRSETLAKLNRRHSADDTVRVFEMAKNMGFDIINMDLIAGLKYENSEDFVNSVKKLIELNPANITVHTLYKKRKSNMSHKDVLDRDETRGSVDEAVTEGYRLLYEAGYIPYYMYRQKDTGHGLENTGFSKPGTECIYNVAMMTDGRDVLSFGAGGVSKRVFEQDGTKFRVERCSCIRDVIGYINQWQEMAQRKINFFELD